MSPATMHRLLVRPKSLTDLAHDSIRRLIVGGELAMGAQLSEATTQPFSPIRPMQSGCSPHGSRTAKTASRVSTVRQ